MVDPDEPQADDELWRLLARTRPPVVDPQAHADAVVAELLAAGVQEAESFAARFDEAVDDLGSWDLWAATTVLLLGVGEEGFRHVRAWIVARGREAFEHARRDPDGYVAHLIGGTAQDDERVIERIEDLERLDGEPLLHAAATALQRLSGAHRSPLGVSARRPLTGEPWEQADVAGRAPRTLAALPEDWLDGWLERGDGPVDRASLAVTTADGVRNLDELVQDAMAGNPELDCYQRVVAGIEAHEAGDHRRAAEVLGPVVDDPIRWSYVPQSPADPADVAYAAGISRLFGGDLDGAARALRMGTGRGPGGDRVRRALAQVELSRGELAAAEQLLDPGPRASLMDRALMVTLRWRQGARDDASQRAQALVLAKPRRQQRGEHPWTVAGALLQAAFVLGELGDLATLQTALARVGELIRTGPAELPAHGQWRIVVGCAFRLEGRLDEAADVLAATTPLLDPDTCDRGLLEREQGRLARARGDEASAQERFRQAAATLDAAGERWLRHDVEAEAGSGAGGA